MLADFLRFLRRDQPTTLRLHPNLRTRHSPLEIEKLEERTVPSTTTFAQFQPLMPALQAFVYDNNGTSATLTTIPGGDPVLVNFDTSFAAGITTPVHAHLFLSASTTAKTVGPVPPGNQTTEQFPTPVNTLQITLDTPVNGKTNFLSVTYTGLLEGQVGLPEAASQASDSVVPPDIVSFTSDFFDFSNSINHGFSLAFSSVLSNDGSGGLQVAADGFFKSFTASGTGTFDTNFAPLGEVQGVKFEDINGDGIRQPGEPGLAGFVVDLLSPTTGQVECTTTSGTNGEFTFMNVASGTYSVREVQQAGYSQTTPNPPDITVTRGSDITGLLFGNHLTSVPPGEIQGVKFDDLNANGIRDANEPGLAGFTIELVNPTNGQVLMTTVSAANGAFAFTGLVPGTYGIQEVQQTGWVQTTASPTDVTVTAGSDTTGILIGNYEASGIILSASGGTSTPPVISKLEFFNSNIGILTATNPPGGSTVTLAGIESYVSTLYQTLLDRAPDPAGYADFVTLLLAGASRQQVATMIWDSPEHRGIEVDQFYMTFLGRAADPAGRAFWVSAFLNGATELDVERAFLDSPEYNADHPTDASFLTGLYAQVLGRQPDADGEAYWLEQLQTVDRDVVVNAFLTSAEADERLVEAFYTQYLGRQPDSAGEAQWVQLLLSGQASLESVAVSFLASDEFFARFSS
ncbi:MAG TPA: DUF4214 domain-containing protein [Gemmataceae bacterium]|nr:DUF4214 domain-containing protein [Gemmataceae bacterium]